VSPARPPEGARPAARSAKGSPGTDIALPRTGWADLRRRLDAAAAALAQAEPGAEARARILNARARAIAREPAQPDSGDRLSVVEFTLAYERYAVATAWVREVVPLRELTPLPGAPAFVAGLINVRGRVVSVVDLKAFFELPPKGLPELNRVLIVAKQALEFGLLVDAVTGVGELRLQALQPALPTHTGLREDYLRGLTPERQVVLDLERILDDTRIVVRQAPP
jgi:purine-binding chemotaxis protein CheW